MQKKFRKNKPETKDTGYQQRVGGKGVEMMGKWEWHEAARMRRLHVSLSPFA